MSGSRLRRYLGPVITLLATALLMLSTTPLLAATPINDAGMPGKAVFTDTERAPGARCQYRPESGRRFQGLALGHVNVAAIRVYGSRGDRPQQVGIQVWLQQQEDGVSVRRAGGEILTGQATSTVPVTLDPDLVSVPRHTRLEGVWRAIVKVSWYDRDASVDGWRTYVIDEYRTLVKGSNGPLRVVRNVCQGGLFMVD
jgi:hypothetical protein